MAYNTPEIPTEFHFTLQIFECQREIMVLHISYSEKEIAEFCGTLDL